MISKSVVKPALDGALRRRIPPEPPLDSIVVFRKTFGEIGSPGYIYIAIRTANGWFVSCRSKAYKGCTWDSVIDLVYEDETEEPKILLVTDFEVL